MISEKNLKVALQVILFSSIGLYILLAELPELLITHFGIQYPLLPRIFGLLKVLGLVISVFTVLSSFRWPFLLKRLYGDDYIAGKYHGESFKVNDTNDVLDTHMEEVIIEQNLLTTKIKGRSSRKEDTIFYSNWQGKLIDVENNHFRFLVNVQTPSNQQRTGIIKLHIEKGSAEGFGMTNITDQNYRWKFALKQLTDDKLNEQTEQ